MSDRATRWGGAVGRLALAGLSMAAQASPGVGQADAGVVAEVAVGDESQDAPLVRLDPQGLPLVLPGLERSRASPRRVVLQGHAESARQGPWSASVNADLMRQQAPDAPGFDQRALTLQPTVHHLAGPLGVGLGWQWQRFDVAGAPLRRVQGWQLDLSRAGLGHSTSVMASWQRWRHPGELSFMDARTGGLSVSRLWLPSGRLERGMLTLQLEREHNERGHPELSRRTASLQGATGWRLGRWSASVGGFWQTARHDRPLDEGLGLRVDRARGLDAAVAHPLGPDLSLRLGLEAVDVRSRQAMAVMSWRRVGVSLRWEP